MTVLKYLASEGMLDPNAPEVVQQLHDLHPAGHPPPVDERRAHACASHVAAALGDSIDDRFARIMAAAAAFPPASGADPSGLRPSHLLELLRDGDEDGGRRLLRALDGLISAALRGSLPQDPGERLGQVPVCR